MHDANAEGCATMKNRGVTRALTERDAMTVVVLDDDCFPTSDTPDIDTLRLGHLAALEPAFVPEFKVVCDPPSRGTPYYELRNQRPVAASVGFWTNVGDFCAVRQLAQPGPMSFDQTPIFGHYFALCGMNLAFRPRDWLPWCRFIDVNRYDDIWMGWLWQREAYRRGHCFNLGGPIVEHSRQSNVWVNLKQEAEFAEQTETLWQKIAMHSSNDYDDLRSLLPV